jgi:hypothetical protein
MTEKQRLGLIYMSLSVVTDGLERREAPSVVVPVDDIESVHLCVFTIERARDDLLVEKNSSEKLTVLQRRRSIDWRMVRSPSSQFVCEQSSQLIELKSTKIFAMEDLDRISVDREEDN